MLPTPINKKPIDLFEIEHHKKSINEDKSQINRILFEKDDSLKKEINI